MASIKVKFRASSKADREGTIYYQVIHRRKVRQIVSSHHVYEREWDDLRGITIPGPNDARRPFVQAVRDHVQLDLERLGKIVNKLESQALPYSVDDIVEQFSFYTSQTSLFGFMQSQITRLRITGKSRTAETYTATLRSFRRFRHEEDIMLDWLSSDIMEAYEAYLKSTGLSPNSCSFYTRILRAVYNRAVEQGLIQDRMPFKHIYTGVDKTVKRALPFQLIKQIKGLDLHKYPTLEFARDMFMMSFYLRGMSFIDMAYLRKSDLKNGCITYRRRKTGQQLIIAWTDEMQEIINRYPYNPTEYLLPIITSDTINDHYAYRNVGYNINHNLKSIAAMVGISVPLTMYVARHSWASAAREMGIPISVISEGMGHNSEATTRIYLASLDTNVVDRANQLILSALS
ncbi:MAG: tyrosine-type recombinase/integrase [Muribaculaceae bacterium]